ncbi:ribosomal RNA-processing protein 8 [Parasteatoda tepidariorum]|uniref:ribosomal RNA-processing protein 8 n=1 Tax=Parasteatoda tepidariorum TaxID=114398 RepID=UPI001C7279D9|nr:ribosomal RNA-processing protein 8-like isoform X1 [Parasteatoda tepidariorum]XP_042901944.1 ribosomal RNA-processing protein 8-like isoform X2 [Parasteatoda tepidariorum]
MNSAQLMDEKGRKRMKFRKKHINYENNTKLDEAHENAKSCSSKKKRKRIISGEKKDLFLQKKKNSKNISKLILDSGHIANTVSNEISADADIKKGTMHDSEEEFLASTKAKKSFKQSVKSIKKNVSLKKKSSDCIISQNIQVKRKHSDLNLSSAKNPKRKKNLSCDSNSFNNKSKKDRKKASVLQKTETENFSESDSNEDQILRNELESFSIYKNIQKLIKDDPSLLASANYEEELSETESVSLNEESSEECADDSDGSNTESKTFSRDKLASTSNKKEKLIAIKYFDRTLLNKKEVVATACATSSSDFVRTQVNKNEKVVATASTASSHDFDRTQKVSLANKDGKVISQSVASNLKNKALEKLQGAKFRYLNEKLYTESGKDSFNYFQKNREEYMDYHKGYSLQVSKWPLNPVDKIISSLQKMKKNITIADMGCGDAKIARTLSSCIIHSFDLVALNDFVTPCNISKVPLSNESVDVVVFCLSLMGTNLKEYIQEAYRIAKFGGILKIAEVESRIPNLDQFIKSIQSLGFSIEKKDVEHKLFVFLEFKKMKKNKKGARVQDITLKPCLYKKR